MSLPRLQWMGVSWVREVSIFRPVYAGANAAAAVERAPTRGPDASLRPPRIVRSALLVAYIEAARSVGLDPEAMMRRAGIPPAAASDPELRLSFGSVRALLSTSALLSGREDFGLLVGDHIKLSMLGALSLLMRAQPTVQAAFEVYARYIGHLNDTVTIHLKDLGDHVFVIPVIAGPPRATPRASIDTVMGQTLQFLRSLAPGGRPELTCFAYPAPADTAPHRQRFGSVEFDHECSGLLISKSDLARSLSTADADAARTLVRVVESQGSVPAESMVERVSSLIERLLPSGDCSARRVAQMLGVDRRTLHRRLAMEGVTFTSLLDQMRRDMAVELLRRGGRQVTEVADLLGFSSISSFSRWFHRSHGTSAREYRKAA
ncbi:MAG TPA: AraC family transcriptional regulator [Caulobacteraceae bacterium]|nr:AraC family transcriptional regulator [Caulobacteraceae bacterium]